MSWFSGPKVPARVPTDQVIPLHFWDDSPLYRRIALYNLKVFDDVLDPQKLRASLETLVSQTTWRKLGGRLRKDAGPLHFLANGKLEYHIPSEFTEERPAVAFSQIDSSDVSKADHPLASRLPKPSIRPGVVGDPDETLPLACGKGCPTSIDDYLYHDRPALGLHIVSLKDATLVTLHWLHIACDAMGMEALVRGWVLAMNGQPVPAQQGFDSDPLLELGTHPTEEHVLAEQRMTGWAMTQYGMRNGYGLLVAKKECRMVCIPGAFLDKLRMKALEELKEAGVEKPFLTENDVLVAWWTRIALSHIPSDSKRPVTVQVAMSLRKALSEDLLTSEKPYISNCFGFTNLLTTVQGVRENTVSDVAAQWRSAINTQSTRAQIEAYQAMVRESVAPLPVFFGNGQTYQVSYSNWTKADLYGADFSAVAVTPRTKPLYASYIAHCQVPFQFPEGFIIVGKDQARNTWLCGYRALGLWDRVVAELNALEDD